jgi:hypothetical protein
MNPLEFILTFVLSSGIVVGIIFYCITLDADE